jgi:hypothetical protein
MSLLKIRQFSIDQSDTFTFANANITGNLNSGNANLGNLAIANFFSGNGNALFSIQAANISGQVANATVAGTVYTNAQPNITSVGSLSGLTVSNATGVVDFTTTANVTLGSVANLHITGGTSGQVLTTDGSGTLTWASASAGTGNANIAGSNTQIFFNNAGSNSLGASANLTFNSSTNTLTVDNIVANGSGLTSITGANVTGFVANANVANTAFAVAGANVSGAVSFATTANAVAGANVSGEVSFAATANAVAGANVSGAVGLATYATTANAVAGANVSGAVSYATTANAVAGANVSGQVANALVAGTVYTAAQPNITSVGTLTSLDITGNVTAGNANLGNAVTANFFIGSGNNLSNIQGANVSGAVGLATYATTANAVAGANVSGEVAFANVANNVAGANVSGAVGLATYATTANAVAGANVSGAVSYATTANAVAGANVSGAVSYATTANAVAGANVSGEVSFAATANAVAGANVSGQVGNALIAGTVYTNAQPNITSVGTLSSLSVTGDIGAANLTLTGNLIISGTTTSVNSTVTQVVDPIFELGGGANGAVLIADDNKDRGLLLHYYSGSSTVDAFMGWDDSNGEFGVGSNVSVTNEVVTFNSYGNIRANVFFGNGSQLTGVSATTSAKLVNGTSNVDIATTDGNVTVGVSGNAAIITVTGTGVNIAGYANLGSGNLLTTGNVTVGYIIGNGSSLTSIAGANVSGFVANANVANTAFAVAGANVSGEVSFAATANAVAGANVSGFVANANVANTAFAVAGANVSGEVSFAATANAVAGANVSGFVANANVANTAFAVAGANVSGEVSFAATANAVAGANVSGTVSSATTAGTVTTAAQGNITSLGTLTGLTVTGNVALSGANVTLGSVANLHIGGGSANYYLQTDGSGALSWAAVPTTSMNVDTFTGDGSWTMKTLTATPENINYTLVAIGGVFQPRDAYSVTTNVITFDDPPPNGAIVEITTIAAGAAGGGGGGASWTYSAISANTTAVAGYRYIVDTSTANLTITLPASGTLGDEVMIIDGTGNASTHEITVGRNGGNIQGLASNMTVTTDRAAFTLVYYNSTQGWILTNV